VPHHVSTGCPADAAAAGAVVANARDGAGVVDAGVGLDGALVSEEAAMRGVAAGAEEHVGVIAAAPGGGGVEEGSGLRAGVAVACERVCRELLATGVEERLVKGAKDRLKDMTA
jgi:hypothetical protein